MRKRKVAKRKPAFLEARKVAPVLPGSLPGGAHYLRRRSTPACARAELFGLRKKDVDLERRLLTVGRSYARNTTKGGHEDAIPIARELVPYLEQAMRASPSGLLFARADGSMWSEHAPLGEKLRSAMGRAGIVEGYRHVCRRCKAGRKQDCEERHPDDVLRRCKTCNMKLMACPVPRRLRFHDLRASLLLASGVDLFAVQRILRHSDPKITSETYAHLPAISTKRSTAWSSARQSLLPPCYPSPR